MIDELYTFADMFSGCGGLSYGFNKRKSFSGILAVDNWKAAERTYCFNHPGVPFRLADLSTDDGIQSVINILKGKVDVIIGGPPCQGFSTLGKRKLVCELCTLVDSFFFIIQKVQPKIVLMENVRGFTSKPHPNGGSYPDAVHRYLEGDSGLPQYIYSEFLINAQEYGLAQTRTRYILIAVRSDIANSKKILEAILYSIESQKSKKRPFLKDVIGDLPHIEIGGRETEIVMARNGRKHVIHNHQSLNHSKELQARFSFVPPGGGLLDVPIELLTPHLKRMVTGSYGNGGHIKNIYGRMEWNKPSGTIVAGMDKITGGRFVHPEQNRLLTPRECARIQSYPDSFRFFGSLVNQYYLIGNSVPPKLSTVFAKAIEAGLNSQFS